MKLKIEKQAEGKYDVLTLPPYPVRVGYITGAKRVWLAECGRTTLGYHKSRAAAIAAISGHINADRS